jgi:hypothetical protein
MFHVRWAARMARAFQRLPALIQTKGLIITQRALQPTATEHQTLITVQAPMGLMKRFAVLQKRNSAALL